MAATVVHHEHIERVGPCYGELVQKNLEQVGIQFWQAQKVAIAILGCDGCIQLKILKSMLKDTDGFGSTCRTAPPWDRL